MNEREKTFFSEMSAQGKTLVYHPKWFYLADGDKYMPDFYCKEDEQYIELAGTRQAYHQNKDKYDRFQAEYPKINFRIVHQYRVTHKKAPKITGLSIARKHGYCPVFISHVSNGKRFSSDILLVRDIAIKQQAPAINFLTESLGERYSKAFPDLMNVPDVKNLS